MSSSAATPSSFLCPITCRVMVDPVSASDGYTYERSAIMEWLSTHSTSPMTRQHMTAESLRANIAMRHAIEEMGLAKDATVSGLHIEEGDAPTPQQPLAPVLSTKLYAMVPSVSEPSQRALLHVELTPPAAGVRQPCALICVLDTSGSMGLEATGNKDTEGLGFSRLDLVKHSVKTIASMLEDCDSMAIIGFSSSATTVLTPTAMNDAGKALAKARVDTLEDNGQTNLWDGLRASLDLARGLECEGKNVVIVVLTDGEPNINPPRGILPTLERYMHEHPVKCTLHGFGFGYQLDSELLSHIARQGDGLYAYIPDCTMVGTVFINFLSYVMSAACTGLKIELRLPEGCSVAQSTSDEKDGFYNVGMVQFGQTRNLAFLITGNPSTAGTIEVTLRSDTLNTSSSVAFPPTAPASAPAEQVARLLLKDTLTAITATDTWSTHKEAVKALALQLQGLPQTDFSRALHVDLVSEKNSEGQVGKAVDNEEWYRKWGKHYLPSVLRAHTLEVCNNFKDAAVQLYASKAFQKLQTRAEDIFSALPAPVRAVYAAPVDMRMFVNAHGGCFAGDCLVRMADGSFLPAKSVRAGDVVASARGTARVVCAIHFPTAFGVAELVQLGALAITPWHPVLIGARDDASRIEWTFPADVAPAEFTRCDVVVNFVLDSVHVLDVAGVQCVTLGHGLRESPVVEHEFFGTRAVIQDLKTHFPTGWADGFIRMPEGFVPTRDVTTGRIVSFASDTTAVAAPLHRAWM